MIFYHDISSYDILSYDILLYDISSYIWNFNMINDKKGCATKDHQQMTQRAAQPRYAWDEPVEVMVVTRTETTPRLSQSAAYKYLESWVHEQGVLDKKIRARVRGIGAAWNNVSGVMYDRRMSVRLKVTVDLRGVFWGKQYSALCINGKYINLYIIGELI